MRNFIKLQPNSWLVRTTIRSLTRAASYFIQVPEPRLLYNLAERIIEYPFVFSELKGHPVGKVLDVGCTDSKNVLPFMLASLGWEVYGIDIQDFGFKHPNFHFVRGDITNTHFPDNFFNCVYSISTLEHIGIKGSFGIDREDTDGDKKATKEIARILEPNGTFLVTLPYGKPRVQRSRRYDKLMLEELISGWRIDREAYCVFDNERGWVMTEKEVAEQAGHLRDEEKAIVLLKLSNSK